eukprot:scaffold18608_cov97-Isochrysis_galbana.AAC.5
MTAGPADAPCVVTRFAHVPGGDRQTTDLPTVAMMLPSVMASSPRMRRGVPPRGSGFPDTSRAESKDGRREREHKPAPPEDQSLIRPSPPAEPSAASASAGACASLKLAVNGGISPPAAEAFAALIAVAGGKTGDRAQTGPL